MQANDASFKNSDRTEFVCHPIVKLITALEKKK